MNKYYQQLRSQQLDNQVTWNLRQNHDIGYKSFKAHELNNKAEQFSLFILYIKI